MSCTTGQVPTRDVLSASKFDLEAKRNRQEMKQVFTRLCVKLSMIDVMKSGSPVRSTNPLKNTVTSARIQACITHTCSQPLTECVLTVHEVVGRTRPTETGNHHDDLYRADPATLSPEKLTVEARPLEATIQAIDKQQSGTVAGFHWVRERVLVPSRRRTSSKVH